MSQFLSEQLDFFGKQAHSENWREEHDAAMFCRDVEDAVAFAIQLKERIDRMAAIDPKLQNQWEEAAARLYIPWYQRWYDHAREVLEAIRRLKKQGYTVAGVDLFMKSYLQAQSIALHFDKNLESIKRIEAGQSNGIPLEQAFNEIQRRSRGSGDR